MICLIFVFIECERKNLLTICAFCANEIFLILRIKLIHPCRFFVVIKLSSPLKEILCAYVSIENILRHRAANVLYDDSENTHHSSMSYMLRNHVT